MSGRINVTFQNHGVTTLLQNGEQRVRRAIRNASNRTGTKARGKLAKEAAKEYVIGSGKAKTQIEFQRASGSDLLARLVSKGRATPLIDTKVSPKRVARRSKRGGYSPKAYKVQIKKESGWKTLQESPKPFIQAMGSGHIGVFRRMPGEYASTGKSKIKQLYTLSVPQMFENDEVLEETRNMTMEYFYKRLDHELHYVFRG